jgi:hypothetical protein
MELWEPAKMDLLGRYPRGHPYHQNNLVLRFFPLVMTIILLGLVAIGFFRWLGQ